MDQNTPLVSICVITYNSAKYVIETLDSAKSQTYKNIELIISDDCSTDNTVEICKQWIECNGSIFKRVELLESAINTGVSANLNRAYSACKGEWVKGIAGDDILLENCIADNVDYVKRNPEAEVVLSKMIHYYESFQLNNIIDRKKIDDSIISFLHKDISEQLYVIVRKNFLPAPTLFVKNGVLSRNGLYNEEFFYEDWPTWITLIENQVKIYYLDKSTVGYRHHKHSLTASTQYLFNIRHLDARICVLRKMCYKYYSKRRIYIEEFEYRVVRFLYRHHMDISTKFNSIVYKTLHRVCALLKDGLNRY